MQNKNNKIAIARITLRYRKILEIFGPKRLYFLFFHKICLFFWVYLKKSFFRSIFNAVFNIVKINFSSKFLHGTPYSTADFSPRKFQANRSVTVKALSFVSRQTTKGIRLYLFPLYLFSRFKE